MGIEAEVYSENWTPESLLNADDGGAGFRACLDLLARKQAAFKAVLDRGVSPDEFQKGQAILGAYDAAIKGMRLAWEKRHGRG